MPSIAINAASLGAAKMASDVINFALLVLIARFLGAEGFGVYGLGMALGGVISLAVGYGWANLLVRDVAARRQDEPGLVGAVLGMQVLALAAVAVVTPLLLGLAGYPLEVVAALHAMVIYQCLLRMLMVLRSWFNAHEESRIGAGFDVLEKVLALVIGVTLLLVTRSIWPTLVAFPLAAAVVCTLSFLTAVRRYGAPRLSGAWRDVRSQVSAGAPFFVVLLVTTVLDRAGVLMLGWAHDVGTVGIYSAADRLVTTGVAALGLAAAAFQPVFARLWQDARDEALGLLKQGLGLLLLGVAPVSMLGVILAEPVMGLLFGPGFAGAVGPLRILALMLVPTGVHLLLSLWLLATGGHRAVIVAKLAGLAGFVVLLLALVPTGAETGLAWARALGGVGLAVCTWLALRLRGQRIWPVRQSAVALTGVVAGGAVAVLAAGLHEVFAAAGALVAYLLVLALCGELGLARARQALRQRNP